MKITVYAIEHRLGTSLVRASTKSAAEKIALRRFGTVAAPFIFPIDQAEAISSAKSMGARVIERED